MDSQMAIEAAESATGNGNYHIALMEQGDIQKAATVLSTAMLNNPLHRAVFMGNGEKERQEIEKMFFNLLKDAPGIVFLAKDKENIIGVMRIKSCKADKFFISLISLSCGLRRPKTVGDPSCGTGSIWRSIISSIILNDK